MKAEIEVMLLQAKEDKTKEHQILPAKCQKLGERSGTDPFLRALGKNQPADTFLGLLDTKFLLFKPPVCGTLLRQL